MKQISRRAMLLGSTAVIATTTFQAVAAPSELAFGYDIGHESVTICQLSRRGGKSWMIEQFWEFVKHTKVFPNELSSWISDATSDHERALRKQIVYAFAYSGGHDVNCLHIAVPRENTKTVDRIDRRIIQAEQQVFDELCRVRGSRLFRDAHA